MLMPIGMSFLYRLAPPDRRGAVMGAFGIPILLGPALGPVLSGWLLEYSDWRLIFLINLPVGILAVFVALRALPALPALRAAGALDTLGIVLGPLGFTALSFGISQSTTAGWTGAATLVGLAVGVVALVAFVARELAVAHPLLELRVFRSRDFSLAMVTMWVVQGAMFGSFFLIPVFLQQVRGYGSFQTGLATLPQALVAAVFMPIGGRLFDRVGARPPVLAGLGLIATALYLLSGLSATTTAESLRLPLALMGAGMGLMMMPLNTHVLNSAPRHLVSRVTSLTGAMQNVVVSLAIATYATYLQARTAAYLASLGLNAGPGGLPTASEAAPVAAAGSLPPAVQEALAHAFGDVYRLAMTAALVALLLALTLRRTSVPAAAGEALPAAAAA
jgi:EmrB/QacA subfamily drug resistance transporter